MNALIDKIFMAAQNPSMWEEALDEYVEVTGVYSACLFSINSFTDLRMNFSWSKNLREFLSDEVKAKLVAGDDENEREAYAFMMRNPPQVPYDELQIFGVSNYADLPPNEFRSAGEALGAKMRIPAVLNRHGPWMDGLFAHTHREGHHRAYCTDPTIRLLIPVIANSISLGRTLTALREKYQAALSVLDQLDVGVLLIDGKGEAVLQNEEAGRILSAGDAVSLSKEKHLNFSDEQNELLFRAAIKSSFVPLDAISGDTVREFTVERRSGRHGYLIAIQPLKDGEGEFDRHKKFAFVTMIDPARENVLSASGISLLGQLTTAEAAVAEMIISGLPHSEIAERRNVAVSTIKSQNREVLSKLRCVNRGDLVRVAAATTPPFK